MPDARRPSLTYRDAGVDIDAGDALVEAIKPYAARTTRPGVMGGLGGFGSLFALDARLKDPLLVAGTDGVGTKLRLAIELDRHDTVGIDLVAMCANDVVVQGAEPLFFLDYFATGHLDVAQAERVIRGIARGCELAGAALVGGETAEMPGMYHGRDYDLAGFCVGVVERARLIDGSQVAAGDRVIGIASSGAHSNGYSLIRRIVEVSQTPWDFTLAGRTLADWLLTPTEIYVRPLLTLLASVPVHAMAHITGGGLPGNVPRVLPKGTRAVLDTSAWARPAIFEWLKDAGGLADDEFYRTFNGGLGMVVVLAEEHTDAALSLLHAHGLTAAVVGEIDAAPGEPLLVLS